jgi:hypothetical protein
VVDRDQRLEAVGAQGGEDGAVVRHLVLVGQLVQCLEVGEADGAVLVRDIHRRSGIREDPAPLDTHPEGVHAEVIARQLRVRVVLDVCAWAVLRHPLGQPEQLIDRIVHPPVPVGIRIDGGTRATLGLEAGVRHAPVEVVGERQVDTVDRGDVDRDGLGHPVTGARVEETAEDGHELEQTEGAVQVESGRLVVGDHGERVGTAHRRHRVHGAVGEVSVLVDLDGATVVRSPDDGEGVGLLVLVGHHDPSGDHDVAVAVEALGVLHRVVGQGRRFVEELSAHPGQ